jgi:hypothetical protein
VARIEGKRNDTGLCWEKGAPKERDELEDLTVDERITLTWILKK